MSTLTHRVAAAAYVFRNGRLLLLKRTAPPFVFAPPGGRLEVGEDPVAGALREIGEETSLDVQIIGVAHTWYGRISSETEPLLCINYLARSESGEPVLSREHSEWIWASREEIASGDVLTQDERGFGYLSESLLEVFDRYERWMTLTIA